MTSIVDRLLALHEEWNFITQAELEDCKIEFESIKKQLEENEKIVERLRQELKNEYLGESRRKLLESILGEDENV